MRISQLSWKSLWQLGSLNLRVRRTRDAHFRRTRFEFLEQRRVLATINVIPGLDTIPAAVAAAIPGDTLLLKPGMYEISATVAIGKNLTIKGSSSDAGKVQIAALDNFIGDHIFSGLPVASKISFVNFTIKNAPDFGLTVEQCGCDNPTEENGDAIHTDGVEFVTITNVVANANGGNGFFIVGATEASLTKVVANNNGAFGLDVDSALKLTVNGAVFNNNGISGMEAAGHDSPDVAFTAVVSITNAVATNNGEIGIEIERFHRATVSRIVSSHNVEDGFDADRVNNLSFTSSTIAFNGDDGIEMFLVLNTDFKNLKIFGNKGLRIHTPATEN